MLVCVFVCAFGTRDRGCSAHPVFPAPFDFNEGKRICKTRAKRAAGMQRCVLRQGCLNLRTRERALPLPLWERSDHIDRCDPGEGLRSIEGPGPLVTLIVAVLIVS